MSHMHRILLPLLFVGCGGAPAAKPVEKNDLASQSSVAGALVASPAMQQKIRSGGVIFVKVNRIDPNGGLETPPLAVARLQVSGWPMPFSLTLKNALVVTTKPWGEVEITAWYDQDGDAMSKQTGDIYGHVRITAPADGVTLRLNRMIE